MKVYISGKITGTDDYMERFSAAEMFLRSKGYEVINPAKENAHFPEDTTWETYMKESIKMLMDCDYIYLLDGWELSAGAKMEAKIATWVKIPWLRGDAV